eukprot:GILI01028585.1.p1 GENE.GILI01028585.1~~GILI01028585.1.p1  ORF type:complete len:115 (-),score=17.57 GILI01028585.1:92-436(-)
MLSGAPSASKATFNLLPSTSSPVSPPLTFTSTSTSTSYTWTTTSTSSSSSSVAFSKASLLATLPPCLQEFANHPDVTLTSTRDLSDSQASALWWEDDKGWSSDEERCENEGWTC